MQINKRKFIGQLMTGISIAGMLTVSNVFAEPRCGNFEMTPISGRISHMAPALDGTVTAIGLAADGTNNQVLRYFDGSSWSEQALPSELDGFIMGTAGGTPVGEAWFAGTRTFSVYEFDVVFMRTYAGSVNAFDIIRVSTQHGAPIDISATSSDNVYALSSGGDVYHYDGSSWRVIDVPPVFIDQHLNPKSIYAVSPDDVWIAGYGSVGKNTDKGFVQHWDGNSWEIVDTPYTGHPYTTFFNSMDGSGPNDIWVVGYGFGTTDWESIAMHWDGNSWTQTTLLTNDFSVASVLAMEPGNAWTLPTQTGGMNYWDGAAWSSASGLVFPETAQFISVRDVKKADICDAWVVGDYHDGTAYQPWAARLVQGDVPPPPPTVADIYVANTEVTRIQESRKNYSGLATVTILDADSSPVLGADVSGNFSGPTNESLVVTTGADGTAIFSSGSVNRPEGDWCFTVTDVKAADAVYKKTLDIVTSACEAGNKGGAGEKGGGKGRK